jgi:NhaP-type Na+/H+ or K+/H+ antiporter
MEKEHLVGALVSSGVALVLLALSSGGREAEPIWYVLVFSAYSVVSVLAWVRVIPVPRQEMTYLDRPFSWKAASVGWLVGLIGIIPISIILLATGLIGEG